MSGFLGLPKSMTSAKKSRFVVLPVPYDGTSTYVKGSDKGPDALIEASHAVELYDILSDSEPCHAGIHTAEPITEYESPHKMTIAVRKAVTRWLKKGKTVVVIGGEHSVTTGSVLAHARQYPGLSVLQLDAHADLRTRYEGSKFNHACVMARVKEQCPIVQVGIRSMSREEKVNLSPDRMVFAHQVRREQDWQSRAISGLNDPVYITIDLDVFDPAIMPATGTPEPGGLFWDEILDFLARVCRERDVVGFDVVELCPLESVKAPDFLAAKLVYTLMGYLVDKADSRL